MPHTQGWLLQNHVVYVMLSGELSSEDVGAAFHISGQHILESDDPPVHFLHNWRDVSKFPTSLSEVFKMSQNSKAPIRKVGWVVAYGQHSRLFRFMGSIFFQMFSLRFKLCRTSEEAIQFLCQQDQRLNQTQLTTAHAEFTPPDGQPNGDDPSA